MPNASRPKGRRRRRRSLLCEPLELRRLLAADAVSPVGPMHEVTGDYWAEALVRSAVATAADSTFLVTWAQRDSEGVTGVDVLARRYTSDGAAGDTFTVNTTLTGSQTSPSATALADGGFVVVWSNAPNGIWFQRYDSSANPVGVETRADPGTGVRPSVAALPGGGFVLVWVDTTTTTPPTLVVRARVFNAAGEAQGDGPTLVAENIAASLNTGAPVVAAAADGSFAVTWTAVQDAEDVFVRAFNADATPAGDAHRINTTVAGTQNQPAIAALAGGGYAVSWTADHVPTSNYHAVTRRLAADGTPVGDETPAIQLYLLGDRTASSVAATADGGFVVSWTGYSTTGVYARQFDAAGAPITGDFAITPPVTDMYWVDRVVIGGDAGGTHLAAAWFDTDGGRSGRLFTQRLEVAPPQVRSVFQPVDPSVWPRVLTSGQSLGYAVSNLHVALSERLSMEGGFTGPNSAVNLANWSLKIDGVDRSSWIQSAVPGGYNGVFTMNVTLKAPMYAGRMELTLKDSVRDESGKSLDGDGNGVAGGNFVFALEVNAPRPLGASQVRGPGDTPAVAALKGGGYVLLRDEGNLVARLYDAAGNPAGSDIPVNVTSTLYPGFSDRKGYAVAALNDGGFAVTWPAYTYNPMTGNYDQDVWARRFGAAGTPLGDEFRVHAATPARDEENPAIAATSDGGFVIAYRASLISGTTDIGFDIFAQRFDASGAPVGDEIPVHGATSDEEGQPAVVGLPGGAFVIAWQAYTPSALQYAIRARRFDPAAGGGVTAGAEVTVSTPASRGYAPNITRTLGGDVVIAWAGITDSDEAVLDVYVRRFTSALAPLGAPFRANVHTARTQYESAVAADPFGGFVVAWTSQNQDVSRYASYARRYNAAGLPIGGEFRVSDTFVNFPNDWAPALAVGADGRALFSWTQRGSSSGTGYAVTRAFDLFPQSPWNPAPIAVAAGATATIQAEDFDYGGEGIAYHDTDAINAGKKYRPAERVDIDATTDAGGGHLVGWTRAGEWLEYTIDVTDAGTYLLEARVASTGTNGKFHVEIDGVDKTGHLVVPNTGGWQTFQTIGKMLELTTGQHVVRVFMDAAGSTGNVGNFNWLRFAPPSPPPPPPPPPPPGGQTPFKGVPFAIGAGATTTIQAEDFDNGGQGVAFHDIDASNLGGGYRTGAGVGVDMQATTDTGGGFLVGWTKSGEWLEYTIDVATAGTYLFQARVASTGSNGKFHLEVDGVDKTGQLVVPNTGGWQTFQTIDKNVDLPVGQHVLRLFMDATGSTGNIGNVNWLRFSPPPSPPPPPPPPPPGGQTPFKGTPFVIVGGAANIIEVEDFDNGGEGVAYHDIETTNRGGKYRSTGVDIDVTTDAGGGHLVGWTKAGEWLEYTIDVQTPGLATLVFRVAAAATGGKFRAEIDGVNVTGSLAVPNTGGWQNWTNVTKTGVNLTAGVHVLRLYMEANGTSGYVANFNKITVSPSGMAAATAAVAPRLPMFADLNGDDERAPDDVLPA